MSWNDGEGPWGPTGGDGNKGNTPNGGGNKSSGNPWDRVRHLRPQGQGGGNGSGGGNNRQPPDVDIDELLGKIKDALGPFKPRGNGQAVVLALAALAALWMASGFYQVAADQVGVVTRFGAFVRTEMPGLRYHLPSPIEEVSLPVVTSQNEIQIGFKRLGKSGDTRSIPQESMMLTQDENVINVEFTVFWRITDVQKYLFEIRDQVNTIKMAAESAMREVIGQNKLQFALTEGRGQIAEEARARLQALMDEYQAGVTVSQINLQTVSVPDEVKASFQDVVNARLDQERFQNQAAAHVNKVIPEAKGQAAKIVQEAMAYRDQKIAVAEGEAARFREVLTAYNASRDVTARRIYLETMESVLGEANKVLVDKSAGAGTIPYFPLRDMTRGSSQGGN